MKLSNMFQTICSEEGISMTGPSGLKNMIDVAWDKSAFDIETIIEYIIILSHDEDLNVIRRPSFIVDMRHFYRRLSDDTLGYILKNTLCNLVSQYGPVFSRQATSLAFTRAFYLFFVQLIMHTSCARLNGLDLGVIDIKPLTRIVYAEYLYLRQEMENEIKDLIRKG